MLYYAKARTFVILIGELAALLLPARAGIVYQMIHRMFALTSLLRVTVP